MVKVVGWWVGEGVGGWVRGWGGGGVVGRLQNTKRKFPSAKSQGRHCKRKSQANDPIRTIPNDESQANDPKRKFPRERFQARGLERKQKFPKQGSQAIIPSRRSEAKVAKRTHSELPSERPYAKTHKRHFPGEGSQGKILSDSYRTQVPTHKIQREYTKLLVCVTSM